MGLLLVEVPISFVAISEIRSYLLGWLKEGDYYKADRLLRQFQYEHGMPGGRERKHFIPVDNSYFYKEHAVRIGHG